MVLEFYEKPGCGGNARQKDKLIKAGCTLVVKNLLETKWAPSQLREFFGSKPVLEWFNMTAPSIKDGLIDPSLLNADEALSAMMREPILIKRPLIQKGDIKISGFNPDEIKERLNIDIGEAPPICNPSDPCKQNQ